MPKQKEWKCEEVGFNPGDPRYLPYDWVDEGKLLLFTTERVANRAPRTGPRLVAERKRKRERERKETANAGEAAGAAGAADSADSAETAAGASKRRSWRHYRITEASEEAEGTGDAAAQQLIAEQAAADRSADADADADAINDGDEDASDLVLGR